MCWLADSYAREKELLLDPRLFVDALQRGEFPTACASMWRSKRGRVGRSSPGFAGMSGFIKRGPARLPPVSRPWPRASFMILQSIRSISYEGGSKRDRRLLYIASAPDARLAFERELLNIVETSPHGSLEKAEGLSHARRRSEPS